MPSDRTPHPPPPGRQPRTEIDDTAIGHSGEEFRGIASEDAELDEIEDLEDDEEDEEGRF